MTRERLSGLIRNLPNGLSEIYLHPATGPSRGPHLVIAIAKSSMRSWPLKLSRRPVILRCGLADSAIFWIRRRHYIRPHLTAACPTGI